MEIKTIENENQKIHLTTQGELGSNNLSKLRSERALNAPGAEPSLENAFCDALLGFLLWLTRFIMVSEEERGGEKEHRTFGC